MCQLFRINNSLSGSRCSDMSSKRLCSKDGERKIIKRVCKILFFTISISAQLLDASASLFQTLKGLVLLFLAAITGIYFRRWCMTYCITCNSLTGQKQGEGHALSRLPYLLNICPAEHTCTSLYMTKQLVKVLTHLISIAN